MDILTSADIKTGIHRVICSVKAVTGSPVPWKVQKRGNHRGHSLNSDQFEGGSVWWNLVYYGLFMSLKHRYFVDFLSSSEEGTLSHRGSLGSLVPRELQKK